MTKHHFSPILSLNQSALLDCNHRHWPNIWKHCWASLDNQDGEHLKAGLYQVYVTQEQSKVKEEPAFFGHVSNLKCLRRSIWKTAVPWMSTWGCLLIRWNQNEASLKISTSKCQRVKEIIWNLLTSPEICVDEQLSLESLHIWSNISSAVIIILTDRKIDSCVWLLGTSAVQTWEPKSWHEKDAGKGNRSPNQRIINCKSFFCSRFLDPGPIGVGGMQNFWTESGGWQRKRSTPPTDNPLKSRFKHRGSRYNTHWIMGEKMICSEHLKHVNKIRGNSDWSLYRLFSCQVLIFHDL